MPLITAMRYLYTIQRFTIVPLIYKLILVLHANWNTKMKTYHTYSAVDVAFSLLKHAAEQGKTFTNLQLQKLTYVCHGLSLSSFDRPLIVDDVYAWKFGPVIPSVYFSLQRLRF